MGSGMWKCIACNINIATLQEIREIGKCSNEFKDSHNLRQRKWEEGGVGWGLRNLT